MPPLLPLLRATHLGPSLAVTAMASAFAVALGVGPGRLAVLAGAVLAGQFSIGWANDYLDRHDDRAAGRTDKPLATGELPEASVRVAIGGALVACGGLSLALGLRPGLVHLAAVGFGWAYDLGLKRTALSPLPYAAAFGLLAVFVPEVAQRSAPWWLVVGTALLAAGAHFANTLPDTEHDARTGVRGLPQRAGPRLAAVLAAGLLGAGATVITTGRGGVAALGWPGRVALLACAGLVLAVLVVGLQRATRTAFTLSMAAAGCVVVLLAGGAPLLR